MRRNKLKSFRFVGSRIVKTGVAVFLTAILCEFIGWPPVFAVITAIVTIEPTVSDSIKKGLVRFPASAIGSGYAVLFISLFGNSALTYTLAAVLTITTCYRLNLHAGLLVATLTAVAMVEVIHENFLIAFFIRLGTTTVGLAVSTLVNMFMLPPDYRETISKQMGNISKKTSMLIENVFEKILHGEEITNEEKEMLEQIRLDIRETEKLSHYQHEEEKYHPLGKSEEIEFQRTQNQINLLRNIHYHLNRLIHSPLGNLTWTEHEQTLVMDKVKRLALTLQSPKDYDREEHLQDQVQLMELFWLDNFTAYRYDELTKFPPEVIILYEFLSIYQLTDDLFFHQQKEKSRE